MAVDGVTTGKASGPTSRPNNRPEQRPATPPATESGGANLPAAGGDRTTPPPAQRNRTTAPVDGADLSKEATEAPAPPETDRAMTLTAALHENFGMFDGDEDGHLTDAEVDRALEGDQLSSDERAALTALRGRQGEVEEYHNDEYFDENHGITPNDIADMENSPDLVSQRIVEEFHRERELLAADPNHRAAPLELGEPSVLNTAVDIGGTVLAPLDPSGAIDTLRAVDAGILEVDPGSRLGAYQATGGYREGTVGHAAHSAIGTIYGLLGTAGEERIGEVFNSPEAVALYNEPVDGPASLQLAQMEYDYWVSQGQDGFSFGGMMGSMFSPETRDWLQSQWFR